MSGTDSRRQSAGGLRPGSAGTVMSARMSNQPRLASLGPQSPSSPPSALKGGGGGGLSPRADAVARRASLGTALVENFSPDEPSDQPNRKARPSSRGFRTHRAVSGFTKTVERTVDVLRGDVAGDSYEDVLRILAQIKRQFDEVHAEADRKEAELALVRREIKLLETEIEVLPPDTREYSSISMDSLSGRLKDVSVEIHAALETKAVYEHMVERLHREIKVVQEKVSIMEGHLHRKTKEVEKRQESSRRAHQEKLQCVNRLEDMEQEIEYEREVCSLALQDLDETVQQKRGEVTHREEFERWRRDIAMDAANEAFQATAGRYRKLYAVEKLTGNCLQKMTWKQAEQSQATEDGFQKIREVTGLADVMDIVHKFLNRDMEQEQLRITVREAEAKLHSLREAESSRHVDITKLDIMNEPLAEKTLTKDALEEEHLFAKASYDHEMFQRRLRDGILLFESLFLWGRRIGKSLSTLEELPRMECQPDIVPFFESLADAVDRFLNTTQDEVPPPKLAKLTGQAASRDHAEQSKLLTDKEFMRSNLRVPASLDARATEDFKKQRPNLLANEEQEEQDFALERDKMKLDSIGKVGNPLMVLRGMLADSAQINRERAQQLEDLAKGGAIDAAPGSKDAARSGHRHAIGPDGGRRPSGVASGRGGGAASPGPAVRSGGGRSRGPVRHRVAAAREAGRMAAYAR